MTQSMYYLLGIASEHRIPVTICKNWITLIARACYALRPTKLNQM
jgi:hypothetical protein